jgi:hypothetical protein
MFSSSSLQIITKPMDFSTIKKKMEGKDGTKYNSVREIWSDVRLIFTNAMKYNDEQNKIHLMAKALLEKFEGKWLHFLPKVESEVKFISPTCFIILFISMDMNCPTFDKADMEPFVLHQNFHIFAYPNLRGTKRLGCCYCCL